jgi:hypothetical protein
MALSVVMVLVPETSMGRQIYVLAAQQSTPPLVPGMATPPSAAATPPSAAATPPSAAATPPASLTQVHCHNSACWLSKWYAAHPEDSPTASNIQIMRANPHDVVQGYKIPALVNNTNP